MIAQQMTWTRIMYWSKSVISHQTYKLLHSKTYIYHILKWKEKSPSCHYKWEAEYFYANFDWEEIYNIPYKCTRETHLQTLHYQIINRFFPCNYVLNLWNKEETDLCQLCKVTDTLQHFFVECKQSQEFWKTAETWHRSVFNFYIKFGPLDILIGIPNYNNDSCLNVINFIILFGKHFIKSRRLANTNIDFLHFLTQLKSRISVEEFIYKLNNSSDKFQEKWAILSERL